MSDSGASDGGPPPGAPPPGGPPPPPNATQIIEIFGLDYLQEYNGRSLVNTAIAFIVLNFFFLMTRFASRYVKGVRLDWGDLFLVISFVFCTALSAQSFAMVNYASTGYHIERLLALGQTNELTLQLKWLVVGPMFYTTAVLFAKLALLHIYLRFFTEKTFRIICWVLVFLQIGSTVAYWIANLAQCIPLEKAWRPERDGHCGVNAILLFRWASLPNMVIDLVMLILPLPYLRKLPTGIEVKLSLAATLSVGSIGLITAIVRFAQFFQASAQEDGTWSAARLLSLTIVEPSMYLISACLLTSRPLLVRAHRLITGKPIPTTTTDDKGTMRTGSRAPSYHSDSPTNDYAMLKGPNKDINLVDRSAHGPEVAQV